MKAGGANTLHASCVRTAFSGVAGTLLVRKRRGSVGQYFLDMLRDVPEASKFKAESIPAVEFPAVRTIIFDGV